MTTLREAATELLALKDLKERINNWDADSTDPRSRVLAWMADYARRKPLAWEALRIALAQCPEPGGDSTDTNRLAYLYSGKETSSDALVELEIRLLSRQSVSLDEARAAIDPARGALPAPATEPASQAAGEPVAPRWVVVRESVLDVGLGDDVRTGGKPELGYALLADAVTFRSEDDARAALQGVGLPLGWVLMPLSRLLPDLYATPPAAPAEGREPPKELGESIPWVLRPTGRTIPDLTGREHVCEWQRGVRAAAPVAQAQAVQGELTDNNIRDLAIEQGAYDTDILEVAVRTARAALAASRVAPAVEALPLTPAMMKRGGRYNWKNQPERLIYLRRFDGWHQFKKINDPRDVWCEVRDEDLAMFEETAPAAPAGEPAAPTQPGEA